MFRDVPGCSGMFRDVPGCSGMFRDAPGCSGTFREVPCSWFYRRPSWSNPRQTRILLHFQLSVFIKALLKQISLYLLSQFHIRIIVLICPDSKSARNHLPKSCMPTNHTNRNDARPILFQLKSSLPFSLFLFVWRLESTTTKSLLRHLHCRGSPLFKSRR